MNEFLAAKPADQLDLSERYANEYGGVGDVVTPSNLQSRPQAIMEEQDLLVPDVTTFDELHEILRPLLPPHLTNRLDINTADLDTIRERFAEQAVRVVITQRSQGGFRNLEAFQESMERAGIPESDWRDAANKMDS